MCMYVYLGDVRVWMYDCVDVGVHVKVCTEMNLCIQPKMLGEVGRNYKAPESTCLPVHY